jgi:hypothetical protein
MTIEPVVAEFDVLPNKTEKFYYFIGASLEDIMQDTKGGTEFGFTPIKYVRSIPLDEAEKLGLGYYEEGYRAVTEERCSSFKLKAPEKEK